MKILLVDDEDQVLRGISRMLESEVEEWDVETASSGAEALDVLNDEEFNAIVSDMRMPGMDGAELLELVAKRFPRMLRVVLSGQANRETVLSAINPMHQYLAKPCDPDRLIALLRRAEVFQETIRSAEVLDAIGRNDCLPSIPENLAELNRALDDENAAIRTISEIISKDPALAARILQVANSAIFGLNRPVADLSRAVSVVGNDMIRIIAVSQALFSAARNTEPISPSTLFSHCFRTAEIAKQLCVFDELDSHAQYLAFSSGLLHDVGKIILVNAFTDRYKALIERSCGQGELWEQELEEFGATHQGVGAYLLDLWGLPDEVIEAVASHHSFQICAKAEPHRQVVYAANWLAHGGDVAAIQQWTEDSAEPDVSQAFADRLIRWHELMHEYDEGTSSE